jgi:hypothetical protein
MEAGPNEKDDTPPKCEWMNAWAGVAFAVTFQKFKRRLRRLDIISKRR